MQTWLDGITEDQDHNDLRQRFRSRDDDQFRSAFLELYLHECLVSAGYAVRIHPVVPGSSHRPDFRAERDGQVMFVEAIAPGASAEAKAAAQRRAVLFDTVNRPIDGIIPADPAVYARLPKVHRDESRTQGLDRLELIRFLQVAQTISTHHGALAYLLGINALRASQAAAVRIEDYAETLRGHRVLHLVGKGNKPATMPLTVPVLRVLEACRGERVEGPLVLRPVSGKPIDRRDAYRMVTRIARAAGIPRHISPHSLRHAAITNALDAGFR